ncbi:MAG: flagellar hook-associated protein FlgK [candidate division Zixibacteria bacterium]|nr:flagellar hook-associated protein FlgK [candidate division Zixibacteria bacterium]
MSGLFQGLEIGKQALLTHQLSLSTIGHNIANVSTTGYTRQRVQTSSATPIKVGTYNVGNGVTAQTIVQVRDLFLTNQYRRENKSLGEWTYQEKALTQIEAYFSEPDSDGLGEVLNQFWNSWSDLSNNPESTAARSAVISQGRLLADSFQSLNGRFQEMQASVDQDVVARVEEINSRGKEIANLNRLIISQELGGQKANDLRDQRDTLIDELSGIVDVTTAEKSNGSVTVYISGLAVVENADTFELGTRMESGATQARHEIIWKGTKTAVKITGGELKGQLDVRDNIIPAYRKKLDELAANIVRQVNAVHRTGTGLTGVQGLDFFNSAFTTAGTIQLDSGMSDPNLIAASTSGEPGDNTVALAMADLRNQTVMSSGTATMSEFYTTLIGNVGVDTHEAETLKGNYEAMMEQVEYSRQSIQGVSLDEETANMMKMQQSYNAAARIITTMDEALSTIIQGMGVVGRS